MKIIFIITTLSIFFVGSFFVSTSYGDPTISVTTDKNSYSDSDTIHVTGEVAWKYPEDAIQIQILDSNNNVLKNAETKLNYDALKSTESKFNFYSFSHTFTHLQDLGGQGKYSVIVYYYVSSHGYFSDQTFFDFSGGTLTKIVGTNVEIKHSSFNGKINQIIADNSSKSLTFDMTPYEDGVIAIELPRALLNANLGVNDIDFDVKTNGMESTYKEKDTPSSRILMIGFLKSTSIIKITGTGINLNYNASTTNNNQPTNVLSQNNLGTTSNQSIVSQDNSATIPEFSSLMGMIMAISIIGVVVISRRFFKV